MTMGERGLRAGAGPAGERVLILAPIGRDAAVLGEVLTRAELTTHQCAGREQLLEGLAEGAGAIVMTDHALVSAIPRTSIGRNHGRWSRRRAPRRFERPHPAQELEAIHSRQSQVGHHHVRLVGFTRLHQSIERGFGAIDGLHLGPHALERPHQGLSCGSVVLCQEHAHTRQRERRLLLRTRFVGRIDSRGERRDHGNLDGEGRTVPGTSALGSDRPPVQLDQLAAYRQAKPEATVPAVGGAVGLPKALEDVRQEVVPGA